MTWYYAYSQDLWPAMISVALTIFLGFYSWNRRNVPGAKAFAIGCLFATLWVIGSILEIAALDFSTKVFWVKFHAGKCFGCILFQAETNHFTHDHLIF